jgi:hypothetical protein
MGENCGENPKSEVSVIVLVNEIIGTPGTKRLAWFSSIIQVALLFLGVSMAMVPIVDVGCVGYRRFREV